MWVEWRSRSLIFYFLMTPGSPSYIYQVGEWYFLLEGCVAGEYKPPISISPIIPPLSLKKVATIADSWNIHAESWYLHLRRNLVEGEIADWATLSSLLEPFNTSAREGIWCWNLERDGSFPSKSLPKVLSSNDQSSETGFQHHVWSECYPKRVKFFLFGSSITLASTLLTSYKEDSFGFVYLLAAAPCVDPVLKCKFTF